MKAPLSLALLLAFTPATASAAEQKPDFRAVAECEKRGEPNRANCVDSVHIGLALLAAIERIYGSDAASLLLRCREINASRSDGAGECARQFIKEAKELREYEPNAKPRHPLHPKLSDPIKFALLEQARLEAWAAIGYRGHEKRTKFYDR
jgi:hypothetical protein